MNDGVHEGGADPGFVVGVAVPVRRAVASRLRSPWDLPT
jgi:hypothetical protein